MARNRNRETDSNGDNHHAEKYYGEKYQFDPNFHGPMRRRSCTDVICLLLFVAFLSGWAVLGYYAYKHGDPERVLKPVDYKGRQCGIDKEVSNKPYLFVFDPIKCIKPDVLTSGCSSPSVCLESCPTQDFYAEMHYDLPSLSSLNVRPICLPGIEPSSGQELKLYVQAGKCARWYMRSITEKRISNICFPDILNLGNQAELVVAGQQTGEAVGDLRKGMEYLLHIMKAYEFGEKVVSDILASYEFILGALGFAMVISIVYIGLMRCFAAPIVWGSIFGTLALFGAAIYGCYYYYQDLKKNHDAGLVPEETEWWLEDPDVFYWLMIILSVILGILILVVLFLRKRISLAVSLIKEGGKAVSSITSSLIFPIFPYLVQLFLIVYTSAVILYLATSGKPVFKVQNLNSTQCICSGYRDGGDCDPVQFGNDCVTCVNRGAVCQFFRYKSEEYTKWLHVYNLFGAFWSLFFVSGMSQMILACTFATWYWTLDKSKVPFFIVTSSFFMSVANHSGTVAFGSLIIAIVRMIRVALEYIDQKVKEYSDNGFTRIIMCLMKCCFACMEGFLKFVSKNAYIMCAIHGKGFCASARDAFNLLMRNVVRVFVLDKVMDFVFFMGKLLIIVLTCVALHFAVLKYGPGLNYHATPIIISGIGAYLVASVFFGVYGIAVDTLFLCFLEDYERNDGSPAKPYFMSSSLMRVFGKENHFKRD